MARKGQRFKETALAKVRRSATNEIWGCFTPAETKFLAEFFGVNLKYARLYWLEEALAKGDASPRHVTLKASAEAVRAWAEDPKTVEMHAARKLRRQLLMKKRGLRDYA